MSVIKYRQCVKCGASNFQDPTLTFHFFPCAGKASSYARLRFWAEYCFDNVTEEMLKRLPKSSKLLCSKHFDRSAYTDDIMKKLNSNAVPNVPASRAETSQQHSISVDPSVPPQPTVPNVPILSIPPDTSHQHSIPVEPSVPPQPTVPNVPILSIPSDTSQQHLSPVVSPHLENKNDKNDRIFMPPLKSILAEYRAVKIYLDTCKPLLLRKKLLQCSNLLDVVKFLVNKVDMNKLEVQEPIAEKLSFGAAGSEAPSPLRGNPQAPVRTLAAEAGRRTLPASGSSGENSRATKIARSQSNVGQQISQNGRPHPISRISGEQISLSDLNVFQVEDKLAEVEIEEVIEKRECKKRKRQGRGALEQSTTKKSKPESREVVKL